MRIVLFGKTIISFYSHYFCSLSLKGLPEVTQPRLTSFEISNSDMGDIELAKSMKKVLAREENPVKGYGFRDGNGETVGHLFVMKKGGREVLYKVKKAEPYLFGVKVFESFRGNGFAAEMIAMLGERLKAQGAEKLYFTVQKRNKSALRLYEKLGYKRLGSRHFVRLWRFNIPFHTL